MRYNKFFFTLLVSILSFTVSFASNTQQESIFDLLHFNEKVKVKIAVDMTALKADFRSDKKHKADFSYEAADGTNKNWDIKVKLRGKFRRMKCSDTPPLKLYFDKDDLAYEGLAKHNDLKLVNYCGGDLEEARETLLKEYVTYKMYNQLTEASFRVQLIEVTYYDTHTNEEVEQLAFLIEDTAQLRARLGAKKFNVQKGVARPVFDAAQTKTMILFQYMIGNTDWKLNFEKNTKHIVQAGKLQTIPYDFDYSGIVNPSYATVASDYGTTSLKERVYLGTESDLEEIASTLELFQSKKEALINLIKTNDELKRKTRKEMLEYINSFYENLNPETLRAAMPKEAEIADELSAGGS